MGAGTSSLPYLRHNYRQGGIPPLSLQNQFLRMLSNIRGTNGITVQRNKGNTGLVISGTAGINDGLWSFHTTLDADVVTITNGRVRFVDASYSIAQDTVTLTGATEWVYVWHNKDHSDSGFDHSATEPLSNGNRWVWPLALYAGSGGSYTLTQRLHHGDINVYIPLR